MNLQERVLSRRVMNLKDLALAASKFIKDGNNREALDVIGDLGREASGIFNAIAKLVREEISPTVSVVPVNEPVPSGTDEAASNG